MKLLYVKACGFKNCCEDYTIDLVPKSKKTSEDKEYELQEVAPGLYAYNSMAFVGKNASGKTSALELLDCCYSILGEFRLEGKHYSYDGIFLEMIFYHEGALYRYTTELENDKNLGNKAAFKNEHIYMQPYFKSNAKNILDTNSYEELTEIGELPEDTSNIFFVLKTKKTYALYFDGYISKENSYDLAFKAMKNYNIGSEVLEDIFRIFDENILALKKLDDHNYLLKLKNEEKTLSDTQLVYILSSGTTRGLLLYILAAASLKEGFDLIIDEIENNFHKTLVDNLLVLYKDKTVNKHGASLIFSTHYCEVLDQMGRQDNIWICKADDKVTLENMYLKYDIRSELLKSKQYYNNAFQTAVNYEALMKLKKVLKK